MDLDVLIVGAGPAGAIAAIVLARAGARVRLLDRATFPRDKLCGDTINPGTLMALRDLDLSTPIDASGLRIDGMRVTGPTGVSIEGRYPDGLYGRALLRRDLDWALLRQAIEAGAQFESGVAVRHAIAESSGATRRVAGVAIGVNGRSQELRAPVTIAADGRRSTLAFGLGLARHPSRPRRWAIGVYYEQVHGMSSLGEMHIRRGRYIGVAPIPGGLANVCLVRTIYPKGVGRLFPDPASRTPPVADPQAQITPDPFFATLLADELARDPWLRDRFADARLVRPPAVLGPLAVDVTPEPVAGLLLAGDAAGFIDPMTGDGLRFAIRGGAMAAGAALEALTHGWTGVHDRLAVARQREFAAKWRFNRALRALVASPSGMAAANLGARLAPRLLRRVVATAGDCGVAARSG
jgi:flavin-dependent dehydrogenase